MSPYNERYPMESGWEDIPPVSRTTLSAMSELAGAVGKNLYEMARSPITASENLMKAIGSGDRFAPGLALLELLANVPGPQEALLAKLGPLTMQGLNALKELPALSMYVGPKSALWKKLAQVSEGIPQGAFSSLYDRTPMVEVSDEAMSFKKNLPNIMNRNNLYKLGDVVKHPELFEAYPELKNEKLYFAPGGASSWSDQGMFIGRDNIMKGEFGEDFKLLPWEEVSKRPFLHETQHAIQEREGWARGGSPESVADIIAAQAIELRRQANRTTDTTSKIALESQARALEERSRLAELSPENQYRLLLGEIQARDTASRNALTQAQRTTNPPLHPLAGMAGLDPSARWGPLSTENIPLENAIVRKTSEGPMLQTAYHGSPYKWDKVDLSKAGTGEGAAAYGHGFYATDLKDIAEYYRDRLARPNIEMEQNWDGSWVLLNKHNGRYIDKSGNELTARQLHSGETPQYHFSESEAQVVLNQLNEKSKGHLYKLDIPSHENLLDWDKPLSEQPDSKRILNNIKIDVPKALNFIDRMFGRNTPKEITGQNLYEGLSNSLGSDKAASEYLRSLGVPGHKYLDQGSRGAGKGTYNYVIYDPEAVNVLEMSRMNPNLLDSLSKGLA